MPRKMLIVGFTFLVGLLLCDRSAGQSFNYQTIDVPNAQATWASGISPGGQIVGGYIDSAGLEHGYVYNSGTFTTIDVPGTLVGLSPDVKLETEVNGINPNGDAVGDYFAPPGAPGARACLTAYSPPCDRGFVYHQGQFSNVLVPGHAGSVPNSITPDGSIYGCLHDQTFGNEMFSFVRTQSGNYKAFAYESLMTGGGELADPTQSVPNSMNNGATPDASVIVGLYLPPGAIRPHGYTVVNGVLSDYMFPGSLGTQIWGISPDGDFVGLYRDIPGPHGVHGFLQPRDGSAPIPINYPDALWTEAFGINPGGAIVGTYLDSAGAKHGFLAAPVTAH